jgi:hypothetical protein
MLLKDSIMEIQIRLTVLKSSLLKNLILIVKGKIWRKYDKMDTNDVCKELTIYGL